MANWQKVAMAVTLADGKIDAKEAGILRKALFADGKIDKEEVQFLVEIRNKAKKCSPAFTKLFVDAIKKNVLADGSIDGNEAKWLRKALFADGKIDAAEKGLLRALRKGAKKTSAAFDKLCADCGV